MVQRITIIGGGIVGLATAWRLSQSRRPVQIQVVEKEDRVGAHQSGRNSGVLHCGLYYRPGSLKAKLAVAGIREMTAFCQSRGIPHEICGKLVVATDDQEVTRLRALEDRGGANGLSGLRWLDRDQMKEREPHVEGLAALEVPEEGIVDYKAVCAALAEDLRGAGHEVRTGAEVRGLQPASGGWRVETSAGEHEADFVVNCAGLHSDRVCRLSGHRPGVRIIPFRGEYYTLKTQSEHLVRHLIYPVPNSAFPFLGVHFTRRIQGGIEAGPNAVLALAREGYRKLDLSWRDLGETLAFPGLWRFLLRHPTMCVEEVAQSVSRARFAKALQKLVPEIGAADLAPGGAGVRAQAMRPDGVLVEDFSLVEGPGILHVLNAPSPAATASLAIGGEIASRILQN